MGHTEIHILTNTVADSSSQVKSKMKVLLLALLFIGCAYAFPIEELGLDEEEDCLALFSPEVCLSLEPSDVSYGVGEDAVEKLVAKIMDVIENNPILNWLIKKIPSNTVQTMIKDFIANNKGKVEDALRQGGLKLLALIKDFIAKAMLG